MITSLEIERTIRHLCGIFPERQAELEPFMKRVREQPGCALTDRCASEGHLTVSGTVLHVPTARVLLLHHRALDLWIPPGGHIEPTDDSLPAAAAREVCEETGIRHDALCLVCTFEGLPLAMDFDLFFVPANKHRGEVAHRHYNLRYVFLYHGPDRVRIAPDESLAYGWVALDDPYVRKLYARIWSRLRQLVPVRCET